MYDDVTEHPPVLQGTKAYPIPDCGALATGWQVATPLAAMAVMTSPPVQAGVPKLQLGTVVASAIVPVAVMGPPVKPAPVPTEVTVPPELSSFAHIQPAPADFRICPLAQALDNMAALMDPTRLAVGKVPLAMEPVICAPGTVAEADNPSAVAARMA